MLPPVSRLSRYAAAASVVTAFVAGVAALHFSQPAIVPVLFAMLLALLLSPAVDLLARWRVPRAIGAAFVMLTLLAGVGAALNATWEPARAWLDNAPRTMRTLEIKLRPLMRFVAKVESVSEQAADMTEPAAADTPTPPPVVTDDKGFIESTQEWAFAIATVVFLCFFLLAGGGSLIARFGATLPGESSARRALQLTDTVRRELGRFFAAVTLSNLALGVGACIALYLLEMPNPILWGLVAFLLNYIPYAGSATTFVLLTTIALVSFDGVGKALAVAATWLVLTTLEGQILQPTLVGRRLDLDPVLVFLGLWFGGWLWGIAGVILAVPLMVTCKAILLERQRMRESRATPG